MRKGGYPTFAREVIAQKGDFFDFGYMAHDRLLPWKEPGGNSPSKIHHPGWLGESSTRGIQAGAFFAEETIIRAVSVMILRDIVAFHARRVVVVNGLFICALFRFR
jgi:hypothetical protein